MDNTESFAYSKKNKKMYRHFIKLKELQNKYLKTKESAKNMNALSEKINRTIFKIVFSLGIYALLGWTILGCWNASLINEYLSIVLMIGLTGGLVLGEIINFYVSYKKLRSMENEDETDCDQSYEELYQLKHDYKKAVKKQKKAVNSLSSKEYQEYTDFVEEYQKYLASIGEEENVCLNKKAKNKKNALRVIYSL